MRQRLSLLATAAITEALLNIDSRVVAQVAMPTYNPTPRTRSDVLVNDADKLRAEIAAHNAEVERRKAEKKARRLQRR